MKKKVEKWITWAICLIIVLAIGLKVKDIIQSELDSDNDNISDYQENRDGTNNKKSDTDGDGIDDYTERLMQYSPTSTDSDKNGVADGEEDYDRDGLVNVVEIEIGSDPMMRDTDEDSLGDADEYNIYKTLVTMDDSDEDGLSDGIEARFGLNPLEADTDNDSVMDMKEVVEYTFDITEMASYYDENIYPVVTASGNCHVLDSLEISVSDNSEIFNITIPGYIGECYELKSKGELDRIHIEFCVSREFFEKGDFCPGIYYYNDDMQLLEYVEEQVVEGNSVSADLESLGSYIVLNKTEYEKVWE